MPLVAVPGFGFVPKEAHELIENTFEVKIKLFSMFNWLFLNTQKDYLAAHNLSSVDIPADYSDDIKVT